MTDVQEVDTDQGPLRLHVDPARPERARLLLGHGAGGGVEAPDLTALAEALPGRGVSVLRLEQPWRVAGRRLAGRPETLDRALRAAVDALPATTVPLVLGGRSAGARSACRVASEGAGSTPVTGVVCLAFPLQPPPRRSTGRWPPSRGPELVAVREAGLPLLVVQGGRDAFGSAEDVGAAASLHHDAVHEVVLADHAFAVPVRAGAAAGTSTAAALAAVVDAVLGAVDRWCPE